MAKKKQRIAILGATGSVGRNALRVVDAFPGRFRVVGLSAHRRMGPLLKAIERYRPKYVAVTDPAAAARLQRRLPSGGPKVYTGPEGLRRLVRRSDLDFVLCAIVGAAGLRPVLAAVEAGKDVAIANTEPLVMAGQLIMDAARRTGAAVLPVDSEHSAIFQCLHGHAPDTVARIILTASGGPFHGRRRSLKTVTVAEALQHPTWKMGPKITIDSATLMNKGLEVIEATRLFGVSADQVDVVIHPQSIVHSMVEFIDGSIMAQLGPPDMKGPIQYAMTYPDRWANGHSHFSVADAGPLEFAEPDRRRFPALDLAYAAAEAGGTMPAVLNAANEEAVAAFLDGRLRFDRIPTVIDRVMRRHDVEAAETLDAVTAADAWARTEAVRIERSF